MKVQPKSDDKVGLDPHRSEPRLVQLYGGGARVAVLDMRSVSWGVPAPVWRRSLVAHNAAFEMAFLAKRGIYPRVQCTMQAAGLLLGVHRRSLADACSSYLGVDVPKARHLCRDIPGGAHPRTRRCTHRQKLGRRALDRRILRSATSAARTDGALT